MKTIIKRTFIFLTVLIIGITSTGVNALDYNGNVLPGSWPQFTWWSSYWTTISGDITGDGIPDILTTTGSGFYPSIYDHGGVYAWEKKWKSYSRVSKSNRM